MRACDSCGPSAAPTRSRRWRAGPERRSSRLRRRQKSTVRPVERLDLDARGDVGRAALVDGFADDLDQRSSVGKTGAALRGLTRTAKTTRSKTAAARDDDVQVAVRDRVERARVDGDLHWLPPGPRRRSIRRGVFDRPGSEGVPTDDRTSERSPRIDGSSRMLAVRRPAVEGVRQKCLATTQASGARRGASPAPRRCEGRIQQGRSRRRAGRPGRRRTVRRGRPGPSGRRRRRRGQRRPRSARWVSVRFSPMTRTATASRSTKTTRAAPRERASMPPAPEPANRSSTVAPRRSGSRIANRVSLTRSASGRVPSPGARSRVPAADPAMTRPASAQSAASGPPPDRPRRASRPGPRPRRLGPASRRAAPRPEPRCRAAASPTRRPGARRSSRARAARSRSSLRAARRCAASAGRSGAVPAARPRDEAPGPSRPARSRRCATPGPRSRVVAVASVESETRMQYDCASPRPTRPRSWWSWARPKRSASRISMTVASGTSTPTSSTVVPTSTSSSPRRKRSIVASRSAAFIWPWTTPIRGAGLGAADPGAPRPRPAAPAGPRATSSGRASGRLLVLLDQRHHHEGPVAGPDLADDQRVGAASRIVARVPARSDDPADAGPDPQPAGRQRSQVRDVQVGQQDLAERARDRRGRHQQHVRRPALRRRGPRAGRPRNGAARRRRREPDPRSVTASWTRACVPTTIRPLAAVQQPVTAGGAASCSRAARRSAAPAELRSAESPRGPVARAAGRSATACWRASRSVGASSAP